MINESLFDDFWGQFNTLRNVVEESNLRVIRENPDPLFEDFSNVFIKYYLVSSCSILECFIQELVFSYVEVFREKIDSNEVPNNLVCWSIMRGKLDTKKDFRFEKIEISISKKEIEENCSANVQKTIRLFEMVGVDILSSAEVVLLKGQVGPKIKKRNMITHHNDDASDLSFLDIVDTIDLFVAYAKALLDVVLSSAHFQNPQ